MTEIEWQLDPVTAYWAGRVPLAPDLPVAQQWGGGRMWADTWRPFIGGGEFPQYCDYGEAGFLLSSPENILACLREDRLLESLALTVGWGGMARTQAKVYEKGLDTIRQALETSQRHVAVAGDIQAAWELLGKSLGWTSVMRSKWLHFVARSSGNEGNPPVPIDSAVVLNRLWPWFRGSAVMMVPERGRMMPGTWSDEADSWAGYNRYMTAIVLWAGARGLTTTALENSLFAMFGQRLE